jgi:hypothetical protein
VSRCHEKASAAGVEGMPAPPPAWPVWGARAPPPPAPMDDAPLNLTRLAWGPAAAAPPSTPPPPCGVMVAGDGVGARAFWRLKDARANLNVWGVSLLLLAECACSVFCDERARAPSMWCGLASCVILVEREFVPEGCPLSHGDRRRPTASDGDAGAPSAATPMPTPTRFTARLLFLRPSDAQFVRAFDCDDPSFR